MRFLALSTVCVALTVSSTIRGQDAPDVILLEDGQEVRAAATSVSDGRLSIKVKSQYGSVVRQIPLDQISTVKFGDSETLLESLPTTMDVGALRTLWSARKPLLSVPGSPAGAVGLRLARVLLDATPPDPATADTVLTAVEADDWDSDRRSRAGSLRFEVILRSGDAESARTQAREALADEGSPRLRLAASRYLAQDSIASYRQLVEENPRWEIDPFTRPERDRLYFLTRELLLLPYLERGFSPAEAAGGLWELVQFLAEVGETDDAQQVAGDIIAVFPDTPEAELAHTFLTKTENSTDPS